MYKRGLVIEARWVLMVPPKEMLNALGTVKGCSWYLKKKCIGYQKGVFMVPPCVG